MINIQITLLTSLTGVIAHPSPKKKKVVDEGPQKGRVKKVVRGERGKDNITSGTHGCYNIFKGYDRSNRIADESHDDADDTASSYDEEEYIKKIKQKENKERAKERRKAKKGKQKAKNLRMY